MLKRKVSLLSSLTLLGISALLPHPTNADVPTQTESNQKEWQQPYTPTRLEWLFANLPANHAIMNCVGSNVNNNGLVRWVAFYRWSRTSNGLRLTVNSAPNNLSFCASAAFEQLRYESFQMGLNPPSVELLHYLNDGNGKQIADKPLTYTCFVPTKARENDYHTGRFEDNCRVNTASH